MARATGGVYVDGNAIQNLSVKLGLVRERLLEPGPALSQIAILFETMEAAVFAGHGSAPEFGVSAVWAPWSDATIRRHQYPDASGGVGIDVLVGFGYLRASAINPKYGSIDFFAKEITLEINPKNAGYNRPKGNANYAAINNQTRKFVQISPTFRLMANEIAKRWVKEPFNKSDAAGFRAKGPTAPAIRDERGRFVSKDHVHSRKFSEVSTEGKAKDYANFENRKIRGMNLDHRTTESKRLQQEYKDVVSGAKGNFANARAYDAAAKRVGRFHVSNFDGMSTSGLKQSYFYKANNPGLG
jgi:hypothetical protein